MAVLVVGLFLTLLASGLVAGNQQRQAADQAATTGGLVTRQLETTLEPAAGITHAMDAYVVGHAGQLPTLSTKAFMQGLLTGSRHVKSISLAPSNRIRYIEPVRGNEGALGLDIESIPEQWAPIAPLIEARAPGLIGPFPLVQGGTGLAYRQPVFLPVTGYWGLASTVVDADAVFADAAAIPGVSLDRIALRSVADDGATGDVFWGSPDAFTDPGALAFAVHPPGATWQLAVAPALAGLGTPLIVLLLGSAASVVIAGLAWWALRSRQRRLEATHRLARLADQLPGMLYQLSVEPDGRSFVPYSSQRITSLFGVTPEDVAADAGAMWTRVDPADIERVQGRLQESIQEGRPWHERLRMRATDGSVRWFQTDASPDPQTAGHVVMHGYLEDVTREVEAEEQLRISASVFASTHDGVIIMTADGRIVDINVGFTTLTGYQLEDVRGRTLEVLGSGLTPQDVYDDVRSSLDREGFWRGELINRSRDGDVSAQAVAITAVNDDAGELSHFVAVISALSTLRDDLVTGLPGRQVVDDRLTQAVGAARAEDRSVALIVLGLDRFRDVNDTLGHRVGDLVLKETALRLRSVVREPATVARLGGDEFAVIVADRISPEDLVGLLSTLTDAIREPYRLGGRDHHLTASVGVALFPDDAVSAADLLTAASQALRAAKEDGRDRISYFTPTMQEQARDRARLTEDLRRALRTGDLRAVFQPVVELDTGRPSKCEALVRWRHPELGEISPARFIPLAEASGQMPAVSDWMLLRALDLIPQAREIVPDFAVSVNLSPVEIAGAGEMHRRRVALMEERSIPGSAIVVEITEGVLVDQSSATARSLRTYRDAGLPFAIDDFGTGYSSLSYLQSLDVDFVKIDQSFVMGMQEGNESHALVIAIIEMAHALGLRTIAEGVETDEHLRLLRSAGCDFGQGYLFSKPIPAGELLEWLRARQVR